MSADADKPSMVRSLEETREIELLAWGGTEQEGMVEWRSKDEDGVLHRNCRRWSFEFGMELGYAIQQPESLIEAAKFDLWQEEMRRSALDFQRLIRQKRDERRSKARRR